MKNMPGTERPFSFHEFLDEVKNIANEQGVKCLDRLDYFDVLCLDGKKTLDFSDFSIVSKTTFGGCEGIYSDFYIVRDGKEERFATAKTLEESDDAFVDMSVMAARVCLVANNYVRRNEELFNWSGFDVTISKDGVTSPCGWWCASLEKAKARAAEERRRCPGAKVSIRDNSTRAILEFPA